MSLLSDAQKDAISKTIVQRLATEPVAACVAQRDRFAKHLGSMQDKAKSRGWEADYKKWPGDAPRSYEDIGYYVSQFDALKDIDKAKLDKMLKAFKGGLSFEDAVKAFG